MNFLFVNLHIQGRDLLSVYLDKRFEGYKKVMNVSNTSSLVMHLTDSMPHGILILKSNNPMAQIQISKMIPKESQPRGITKLYRCPNPCNNQRLPDSELQQSENKGKTLGCYMIKNYSMHGHKASINTY